jgi:hypothetical protein
MSCACTPPASPTSLQSRQPRNADALRQGRPEKEWPCKVGARVVKAEKDKRALYSQLLMVGCKQAADSGDRHASVFMPPRHDQDAGDRDERLRQQADGGERQLWAQDGWQEPAQLTVEFRTSFRTGVQMAMAKGLARMLGDTGIPMRL